MKIQIDASPGWAKFSIPDHDSAPEMDVQLRDWHTGRELKAEVLRWAKAYGVNGLETSAEARSRRGRP